MCWLEAVWCFDVSQRILWLITKRITLWLLSRFSSVLFNWCFEVAHESSSLLLPARVRVCACVCHKEKDREFVFCGSWVHSVLSSTFSSLQSSVQTKHSDYSCGCAAPRISLQQTIQLIYCQVKTLCVFCVKDPARDHLYHTVFCQHNWPTSFFSKLSSIHTVGGRLNTVY